MRRINFLVRVRLIINGASTTHFIVMVFIRVLTDSTNRIVRVKHIVDRKSFWDFELFLLFFVEIHTRLVVPKMKRTIRGGVVTTIIVFGLLLIISSVSIAVAFVYFRRKRQRRRQFTYSLESTSDDWEPSGTGYHLFDNWTTNRRSPVPNDVNEHLPITTIVSNR